MARVLLTWIGFTDLEASRGDAEAGEGPIGQVLRERGFEEVVLVSNYAAKESRAYEAWARARTKARVTLRLVELDDPTDFLGIFRIVDPILQELTHQGKAELSFHLSPGTPAMATMWMLLGKTRYPAELLQSSREKGVRTAAVPFDIVAEFVELVPRLTSAPDSALEARSSAAPPEAAHFGSILYRCRAMAEVVDRAKQVAARSVAVLIEGETGTGKELLARAIHQSSPRARGPFVAVNCGALPVDLVESTLFGHRKGAFTGAVENRRGCFQAASGGTLFLDEVGELPLEAQVKLLRAVQDRSVTPVGDTRPEPVNVRLIAATHRNLVEDVQARRFREDLFYRLAVAVLHLPPLRERPGDVGLLVDALLAEANRLGAAEEPGYVKKRLSAGAKTLLLNHRWPGNVRELESTLMRATVWAKDASISETDARAALLQGASVRDAAVDGGATLGDDFVLDSLLDEVSRSYIEKALKETGGNKERARKLLGLNSHQVLSGRMKRLGISGIIRS